MAFECVRPFTVIGADVFIGINHADFFGQPCDGEKQLFAVSAAICAFEQLIVGDKAHDKMVVW